MRVDFLRMIEGQEEFSKEARKRRNKLAKELEEIEEKYKESLLGYEEEAVEIRKIVDEFNSKWDPVLAPRKKEMNKAKKQFKKEIKELEKRMGC